MTLSRGIKTEDSMCNFHAVKRLHKNQGFLLQRASWDDEGKRCNLENKDSEIHLPLFRGFT